MRFLPSLALLALLTTGVAMGVVACKGDPSAPAGGSSDAASESSEAAKPHPSASSSGQSVDSALPKEALEAFVNPAHLPVYQGPTGSIEGTVTVKGDPSPETKNRDFSKCPEGEATYRKLFREGPARPDGSRPVADVIVGVTGYSGAYIPESKPARSVTIDACAISSRAIDMTIGQRLEIRNEMKDKIFAPAFLQQPSPLALVASPKGDPVNLYPQKPSVFTIYDRFGAGSAYLTSEVYVLQQPLHAVTDLEGHYRIDGVPVGQLKVSALLGVINKEVATTVDVHANVVETVNLELSYTTPPAPSVPTLTRPSPAPSPSSSAHRKDRSLLNNLYK